MSTLEERAAARRKIATVQKIDLHSEEHNSFHIHLDVKRAWELLAKLSKERWMEETGEVAPQRVDKSICKFINLSSRV